MSEASDWLVLDDQPKILIDLTGYADINDRSGITISAFDAYDEDTRLRNYTDAEGMLEGGMHLPAVRGAADDRGMDWWGFNAPLIEEGAPSSATTVARGGGAGLNTGAGGLGGFNPGGGGAGGFFGAGKRPGQVVITPPQMPNAKNGPAKAGGSPGAGAAAGAAAGAGFGFGAGGPGAAPMAATPAARKFRPIFDANYTPDERIEELILAQADFAFPFCAPTDPTKPPPKGPPKTSAPSAGAASKGFKGPHNFNEYSAPWPAGQPVLMTRGTSEETLDYLAWRPWQNVTVADHRGDDHPQYSTRMVDIKKNEIDAEKIAGFHSAFKVEESWADHCGVSLYWGAKDEEKDIGRGLFTTSGQFGRDKDELMGYAGESGGGPIGAGAAVGDKHFVGENKAGDPINQGHLWLGAPWYVNKFADAPPEFFGEPYDVKGFNGADWPVFLKYDDRERHDILGKGATPGQTAKGLMRWTTLMPFVYPPDPPKDGQPKPKPKPPPWWIPKNPKKKLGDDDGPFPLTPPLDGTGNPVPSSEADILTNLAELVGVGAISPTAPTDDYVVGVGAVQEKFLNPRPVGLNFAEMSSFNYKLDRPPTEFIEDRKNLSSAIYHWNEQRPTSFAFRPVHKGQIEGGLDDLRYAKNLSDDDRDVRILRSPVVLRADAWSLERGHGAELVNIPGQGRNAWGDSSGGLCFYPANSGICEESVGETPAAAVCFKDVFIDIACPVTDPTAGGISKDGYRLKVNPGRDVLVIGRLDAFGNDIENTTLNSDGDFQTIGDIKSGAAFVNPITIYTGPGTHAALKGHTIEVATSAATATIALPDPTAIVGAWIVVKDGDANAATNNITISTAVGNIDGTVVASSITIAEDGRAVKFQSDGSNWLIVGDALASSGGAATNNFSYTEVLPSETLTIPARQQMILSGGLTLDGALVLDGELVFI